MIALRAASWGVAGLIAVATAFSQADVGDWTGFHGAGPLTGAAGATTQPAAEADRPQLRLRWSYRTADDDHAGVVNSAAIVGERVFVADQKGSLHAIDLVTGERRWVYKSRDGFETAPLVHEGRIYIGDVGGTFHAVSAADGAKVWSVDTGSAIHASANLAGAGVVFGNDAAEIISLNAADGAVLWKQQAGDRVNSAPAVGELVYVSGCDAHLRSYAIADGKPNVAVELPALSPGSPAIAGQQIVVGTDMGKVVAIDLKTHQIRWTYAGAGDAMVYSSPAVADDIVVVGGRDRKVHGIDLATGAAKWSVRTRGDVDSSPAIAAGKVYVGSNDKKFYVLDLKTGKELWSFTANRAISASPALGRGVVVISDEAGSVYCFER